MQASFNNTVITITDAQGNTIAWSSAGAQAPAISVSSGSYISQLTWPSRYWLPSPGLMPTIWWCSMR